MILEFTKGEIRAMKRAGIQAESGTEYSIDQALDLMEQVRLAETSFAKKSGSSGYAMEQADRFAHIADKISNMIPKDEVT